MSTEKNTATALAFFDAVAGGTLDSILTDDFRWWVPAQGMLTIAEIGAIGIEFRARFKGDIQLTIQGVTAEGDRVALEATSHGEGINGRTYENSYHFLFVFRAGRVCLVKEYLDTAYVARFLAE